MSLEAPLPSEMNINRIIEGIKLSPAGIERNPTKEAGIIVYEDVACSPSNGSDIAVAGAGEEFSMATHISSAHPFLLGRSVGEQIERLHDLVDRYSSERSRMIIGAVDFGSKDVGVQQVDGEYKVDITFRNMGPTPIEVPSSIEMLTLFEVKAPPLQGLELFEAAGKLSNNLTAVNFLTGKGEVITFFQILEKIQNGDMACLLDENSPGYLLHVFLPYRKRMGFIKPLAVDSLANLPSRREGLLETHTDWYDGRVPIGEKEIGLYETEAEINFPPDIAGLIIPKASHPFHSGSILLHNGHPISGHHYDWPIIGEHIGTGYPEGFAMDLFWYEEAA